MVKETAAQGRCPPCTRRRQQRPGGELHEQGAISSSYYGHAGVPFSVPKHPHQVDGSQGRPIDPNIRYGPAGGSCSDPLCSPGKLFGSVKFTGSEVRIDCPVDHQPIRTGRLIRSSAGWGISSSIFLAGKGISSSILVQFALLKLCLAALDIPCMVGIHALSMRHECLSW